MYWFGFIRFVVILTPIFCREVHYSNMESMVGEYFDESLLTVSVSSNTLCMDVPVDGLKRLVLPSIFGVYGVVCFFLE